MRPARQSETASADASRRAMHPRMQATKDSIVAAWLIVLYPVLIWFVIGTIGGYLFQEKIKRSGDRSLSVPAVMRVAIDLKTIRHDEAELERQILEVRQKLQLLEKEENALLDQALVAVQNDPSARAEATESSALRNHKLVGIRSAKEQMSKALMTYDQLLKSKREQAKALLQAPGDNPGAVSDVITELQYIEKARLNVFAIMPNQFLTLLLTMAMGALGSLIYITLDYFRDTTLQRPVSWYLFRPFLGMVTAIAIFILAKAGQITISNVHAAGDFEENLNPYLLSFLAIISGLLSEQAVEKIRLTGIALFRAPSPPYELGPEAMRRERWAVGLQEAMKTQGKTAADLASYASVPLQTVEDWMVERRPVPPAAQQVIASWLDTPGRNLFTDIAPSLPAEPQTETEADLYIQDKRNRYDASEQPC